MGDARCDAKGRPLGFVLTGGEALFHLPYSSGRCRHCAPVRAIHIMPSN